MSLNKVTLIGHFGADPGSGKTKSNTPFAYASLATTEKWKDSQGKLQEATEWHKLVFFNNLATTVVNYLKKGSKVYIEGRLQTRIWKDEFNSNHYSTEIVCSKLVFLDSKEKTTTQVTEAALEAVIPETAVFDHDDEIPF